MHAISMSTRTAGFAFFFPAFVCLLPFPASTDAIAQSVEEFYRGKTLNFIVGYPTGGANDQFMRSAAQHIGRHIPGHPNAILRNMPGGGSLVAANHVFNVAPRDGTVFGLFAATTPLEDLLGAPNVKFKAVEFNWIGRIALGTNVTFMMSGSSTKTIQDAFKSEVLLGATGRSGNSAVYPIVLNNLLGTRFKLVMGYKGTSSVMLALEQGEVEGYTVSWDGLRTSRPNWIPDKKVNVILQYGLSRHPDLPQIPTSVELGRNPEEIQILRIVASATEVGKMIVTTPGVPRDRVQALRRAFDAMVRDPQYIADMKKYRLELTPLAGEAMQKLIEDVGNVSPEIVKEVKAIYPQN